MLNYMMSRIDHLISKYNGCINWIAYYQERGNRDDAPKHLAALATEQREVALQIIGDFDGATSDYGCGVGAGGRGDT